MILRRALVKRTRDTRGDDDDISALEGLLEAIVLGEMARNLLQRTLTSREFLGSTMESYGSRGDVGKINSNARGVDNIIQGQLIDQGARLQEQRQGLFWSDGCG